MEPYFDLDGGRALALDGVEYIVYIEKPGPVEVSVKNHSYDVAWIDPATGERTKAKGYKGEHFVGEPPSKAHDWMLHISREGKKESMLKSYKFDSRGDEDSEAAPIQLQEIETNPGKIPFDVTAPPEGDLSLKFQPPFALKVKRDTRATRSLLVEWTAEVTARWRRLSRGGRGPRRHSENPTGNRAQPAGLDGPARLDSERQRQSLHDR